VKVVVEDGRVERAVVGLLLAVDKEKRKKREVQGEASALYK
jgi:hypothetical protein